MFSASDVFAAYRRTRVTVHNTPVLTSRSIDQLCGRQVFFKCEHLQKTGSFKARGALNAVKMICTEGKCNAVITHSSGNFGQALAWAAQTNGLACTVVVPNDAPASKIAAINGYGAKIVFCEPKDRRTVCESLRTDSCEMVDPYDDHRVMAGQGTIAVELAEQVPNLDALLLAVGGGGLCSGIAVAAKNLNPHIDVYCVEPVGKHLEQSLKAEKRLWSAESGPISTIADGIRVLRVGEKCFPQIVSNCMRDVLTVNDDEIVEAMKLIYSRLKQAVEPTAAVSLAALFKYHDRLIKYHSIGLILCGGNVDLNSLPFK